MQLEEVLGFVKQLSLLDKVRLIERVAPEIERDLKTTQKMPKDRGFNKIQNCLEAIRSAFPHPLTPSPALGEGLGVRVKS